MMYIVTSLKNVYQNNVNYSLGQYLLHQVIWYLHLHLVFSKAKSYRHAAALYLVYLGSEVLLFHPLDEAGPEFFQS